MGLTLSHNAFSGSYSSFDRLRSFICEAAGGSWPPHLEPLLDNRIWYVDDAFDQATYPGLWDLLLHEDHCGTISPSGCATLAKDLESLLPVMFGIDSLDRGQIARNGGCVATVKKLIAGCWAAAAANEPLTFA